MRHVNSFFPGFIAGCLLTLGVLALAGLFDRQAPWVGSVAVQTAPAVPGGAVPGLDAPSSAATTEQPVMAANLSGKTALDTAEAPVAAPVAEPPSAMAQAEQPLPEVIASFGQPQENSMAHNPAPTSRPPVSEAAILEPGGTHTHVTRHYPHSPDYTNPVLEAGNPAFPFASMPSYFSLRKMGPGNGPTLLVVGGIQGDEPGGFSAAALLSTQYSVTSGQVWVVPDLNFASILQRDRGVFGDMNRKFAALHRDDPEYALVSELKQILLDRQVDLILNLHDGSGFYRPTFENAMRNPNRWGQSVIIDQTEMEAPRFNQLFAMAQEAEKDANAGLVAPDHRYHIRNTNTREGDKEMEKSLSYFAVINGKPAFGIEASKEFTTEFRSYYHLLIVESFMRQMGIAFERNYPLSPKGVLVALNSDLALSLFDGKVVLPLDNVRPVLNGIPFPKGEKPKPLASRPLLAMVKDGTAWRIAYGNRTMTRVNPDVRPFDNSLQEVAVEVDREKTVTVQPGTVIEAKKSFLVKPMPGYRLNAIGAVKDRNGTEAGVEIFHADFMPRYSVDKAGTLFRLEVYKGEAFCGMVLVQFGPPSAVAASGVPLTAVAGEESPLGF